METQISVQRYWQRPNRVQTMETQIVSEILAKTNTRTKQWRPNQDRSHKEEQMRPFCPTNTACTAHCNPHIIVAAIICGLHEIQKFLIVTCSCVSVQPESWKTRKHFDAVQPGEQAG